MTPGQAGCSHTCKLFLHDITQYLEIEYGKCPKFFNTLFHNFFYLNFAFYAVFFLKYLVKRQTVQALIRLLIQEQSDLGLHCLHMSLCQILWCMKF